MGNMENKFVFLVRKKDWRIGLFNFFFFLSIMLKLIIILKY